MERNNTSNVGGRRCIYFRPSRMAPYLQRDRGMSGDGDELLFADDLNALNLTTTTPTRRGTAVGSNSTSATANLGGSSSSSNTHQQQGDADAAAGGSGQRGGGGGQRISSLNQLLPRVQSDSTMPRVSTTTPVLGAGNAYRQGRYPIRGINNSVGVSGPARRNVTETSSIVQDEKAMASPATTGPAPAIAAYSSSSNNITPDWRLRDRMKTVGVGLVMALNVGTDPPDVTKPHPCAVLQCWMDPRTVSRAKAKEIIGERLEQQYAKWQLARTARPLKYRRALDPTVEDVRNLCLQLRRQARTERILLHYNGHGVPRPTSNGEIWVFDKNHTEYIPLSIADLRQWLGKPSILVLDCSSAGILIPFILPAVLADAAINMATTTTTPATSGAATPPGSPPPRRMDGTIDMDALSSQWVRDTIVLCPCSENEWLPMHPDYPADIFTSCLTTPIPIALRWFVRRNPASMSTLDPDAVDAIPGKANDRKTPLGELNWIFTAVTDSIAWNILPKPLFQRLFRQDLLVASMFRNFLLADRILRSLGCTPVSYPPLPPGIADHALWAAWDLACETLLYQLMKDGVLERTTTAVPKAVVPPSSSSSLAHHKSPTDDDTDAGGGGDSVNAEVSNRTGIKPNAAGPAPAVSSTTVFATSSSISSPFFSEQLTAFEVWLEFTAINKMRLANGTLESPEQLPVVLQVLLSQVHRIRALVLLRRFLDLGPWAVNLSLSLGIFPYVMKLLQSPEYKSLLVSIWASILAFDPSCRVDLLKDGAFHHFVQHLVWGLNASMLHVAEAAKERTLAAFVLAAACHEYPPGQSECIRLNLHGNCCALLQSYEQGDNAKDDKVELHLPAHFRLWLCICLANVVKDNAPAQNEAYGAGVQAHLFARLADQNPDVRAAVCYSLGCLIGSSPKMGSRTPSSQDLQSLQSKQGGESSSIPTTASAAASAGLMPQRVAQFATGPNVLLPGTAMAPGQLQPTFAGPTGVPNLQWHGQPMQALPGQQFQLATGQHHLPTVQGQHFLPQQHAGQFLSQPMQLRSPQHPMQPQYIMQGQPMASHPGLTGPTGFLVGAGAVGSHGQPPRFMSHPQQFQQQVQMSPEGRPPLKPTVFDDGRRLELDLSVIEKLLKATDDASVVVRYEATIALARAVAKYLDAFVVVAQELASSGTASKQNIPIPRGLERKYIHRFEAVWKVIRSLQHEDPFPSIAKAANQVVSVVHEHVLRFRMCNNDQTGIDDDRIPVQSLQNMLSGIAEDIDGGGASDQVPKIQHAQSTLQPGQKQWNDSKELRRVVSEYAGGHSSMEDAARLEPSTPSPNHKTFGRTDSFAMNYVLPKSEFYEWKKNAFDITFMPPEDESDDVDPLSPTGAPRLYRERRIRAARESGTRLMQHFSVLAPKPPKPAKRSIELLLEEEDEEALEAAEQEASSKKKDLDLVEKRVLRNDGVGMTSLLAFHPYEDVLMSCGATDDVSLWSTESGSKLTRFENGNPKFTRITASNWINEDSTSLFLVGCDDGRIRIWGNFLESNGRPICEPPCLVSSFSAAQMTPGERGTSGLITEWQKSGHLLVGGNSKYINCWDLEAEQQVTRLETGYDACVTTMTTAWDYDALGMGPTPAGYKGIGRDIFVAGFSNGAIKVLDLRASRLAASALGVSKPNRTRPMSYMEHKSWVVATSFTGYGSRYELISGTVAGDIKAWDLRMSTSVRTIEAQRSGMTTLSVHPKIPIVATGSHAQFIKILTMDGDTLQVVRYHGMMSNSRIGPVSCLSFHPYKPLLAAGATDTFIGLYTTKKLNL